MITFARLYIAYCVLGALALLTCGCASTLGRWLADDPPPRGWEAADVAWACISGPGRRPSITWITDPESLTCHDGQGYPAVTGERAPDGGPACLAGNWAPRAATVAWRRGDLLSDGALCHELVHERVFQDSGVIWGGPQEHGADFLARVESCKACLRAQGF